MKQAKLIVAALIWTLVGSLLSLDETQALSENASMPFANQAVNGGFEQDDDLDKNPDGWTFEGLVQRAHGPVGKWACELTATDSDTDAALTQTIPVPEDTPIAVTVAVLVKGKGIRSVDEEVGGHAGVRINFFGADGAPIGKSLDLVKWQRWEGTFGWRPWSWRARIPEGAAQLEIRLELKGAVGRVLFDEVELLWGFPDDYDRFNLVVDGGFEYYDSFSPWLVDRSGHGVQYPGFQSHRTLKLRSSNIGRSVTTQKLMLGDLKDIQSTELELDYRLQEVEALQRDGGAGVEIEFRDAQENPIDVVRFGPWIGSTEGWTKFQSAVTVPSETVTAELRLVMEGTNGTAFFDQIRLVSFDEKGPILRSLESRTGTTDWNAFQPADGSLQGALDASGLLDAPAGRHGFLQAAEDGHFYFEDGTRARFFGINLQGAQALPTHEEAEGMAHRLAQLGFNLVRLHHMDAPWAEPNIFDPEFDDTQHLSADSLDRLSYLIAQLKQRGIYVYLDLLVSRKFKKGDEVPGYAELSRGAKGVALFNRRIIELQKKYASDLLNHHNPYTDSKLVDEPAVALTEIINEATLIRSSRKKLLTMPEIYVDELQALWVDSLEKQGAALTEAQADRFLSLKDPEVQRFYADLQRRYFREMYAHLRSVGLKIPIAGSNLVIGGWDLETNAELDFVDRHAYWDHPQGGYGDLVKFNNALITEEVEPRNLAAEPKRMNPIVKLSRQRVRNKPFVVGEWNINWPNEFRAAGPILMAAYASFQDWDAVIQFNFEGKLLADQIRGNFDVSTKPEIFLQFPAVARLFHEQHIEPARQKKSYPIFSDEEPPPFLSLLHGMERIFGDGKIRIESEAGKSVTSDTRELHWDADQGLVRIESDRTQAAVGRMDGASIELPSVRFQIKNSFSSCVLTSIDGRPIEHSKHLLLTTVARSENTDTVYNATRTLLRSSGTEPILMEPVVGSAFLRSTKPAEEPQIFALDASGRRVHEVPVQAGDESLEIPLGNAVAFEVLYGKG